MAILRRAKRRLEERGFLDVTNEALNTLRCARSSVLTSYYVGSVPFVLGFLFFWADMSRNAFAYRRCFAAALGLALLFVWMKIWQAVFARGIREELQGRTLPSWSRGDVARLVTDQTIIQPFGLIAIPLAMLFALPFYSVYGFYQNVTILGHERALDRRTLVRRAWSQALLWPRQSHFLIWLLCPWVLGLCLPLILGAMRLMGSMTGALALPAGLAWVLGAVIWTFRLALPLSPVGFAVASNVAVLFILLPYLLKLFLGIDTTFTVSGWHGIFNSTFLVAVFGVTYLCMDPLVKTAFALRCFYGESRLTGADLHAELRRLRDEGRDDISAVDNEGSAIS